MTASEGKDYIEPAEIDDVGVAPISAVGEDGVDTGLLLRLRGHVGDDDPEVRYYVLGPRQVGPFILEMLGAATNLWGPDLMRVVVHQAGSVLREDFGIED